MALGFIPKAYYEISTGSSKLVALIGIFQTLTIPIETLYLLVDGLYFNRCCASLYLKESGNIGAVNQ